MVLTWTSAFLAGGCSFDRVPLVIDAAIPAPLTLSSANKMFIHVTIDSSHDRITAQSSKSDAFSAMPTSHLVGSIARPTSNVQPGAGQGLECIERVLSPVVPVAFHQATTVGIIDKVFLHTIPHFIPLLML
jgi:hypothetical protein